MSERPGRASAGSRASAFVARVASSRARAHAWDTCARLLVRWQRPRWALPLYRRATHLDAGNPRLWLRRASAAVRAGRLEDAALSYRALARLDPDNPRVHG